MRIRGTGEGTRDRRWRWTGGILEGMAEVEAEEEPEDQSTPDPKTTIRVPATPAPGPVETPNDTMTDFNVCPLPEGFDHWILGFNSMHLHLNISKGAIDAWEDAINCAIIIIPIIMAFSRAKMGEAKDYATTFISHAFPASANTLCAIPAANEIEECSDNPLPWGGIMIKGLTEGLLTCLGMVMFRSPIRLRPQ
ncbi:uncharacterized protein EI90DRAFT_3129270 [Cantharellus anzutake]|uniref:uncharacterized protein n=1 Tax=Cantharellus anzutake TaxID=1750568 RepID=UPI001908CB8C|nr:uncharacterized protein EI90DRAFT_3129270 [Cantharellus anzutake]KAF8324977.1 hypothetical protein EI90DRAFT_3129270 [Cantharellus anzutake]